MPVPVTDQLVLQVGKNFVSNVKVAIRHGGQSNKNKADVEVALAAVSGNYPRAVGGVRGLSKLLGVGRERIYAARQRAIRRLIGDSKTFGSDNLRVQRRCAIPRATWNLMQEYWRSYSKPSPYKRDQVKKRRG